MDDRKRTRGTGFDGSHGGGYGGSLEQGGASFAGNQGGRSFASEDDGPHRGRGPSSWARGDEQLREDVCERLTEDPWLDASGLTVEVQDGVVTLAGDVTGRDDVLHAEAVAMRVHGVKRVNNQLREPGHADDDRLGTDTAERARPDWKILPP
ncbi:MAG TPA: BON domain-containing protein [Phenylobacterium sp.]